MVDETKKKKWMKKRREENRIARMIAIKKRVEANRRRYKRLFDEIDSDGFREWYKRVTGSEWSDMEAVDVISMASRIQSLASIHGSW